MADTDEQTFSERELRIIALGGWDPECSFCQQAGRPGGYFPAHTAMPRCKSGRHNHCSCDTCF